MTADVALLAFLCSLLAVLFLLSLLEPAAAVSPSSPSFVLRLFSRVGLHATIICAHLLIFVLSIKAFTFN